MRFGEIRFAAPLDITRYFVTDHRAPAWLSRTRRAPSTESLAYDACERRRNLDGIDDTTGTLTSQTRGFTSHEMIDEPTSST